MRVVLVRHGQTEMNAHGVYRGRINVSLSARGIEEARAMGRVLETAQLDLIYSSPLNRAIETAREIASFHPGIGVETAEEFTDMNFGKWQGLSVPEVEMRFPEAYRIWVRRPDQAEIACGENLRVVRKRALAGLKRIAVSPSGSNRCRGFTWGSEQSSSVRAPWRASQRLLACKTG